VDDSATGGAKVPIAARGVAPPGVPALEIKPGALDFGSIVPGTDARQALTVVSAGTGAVDISAVVPPAGPDFSIASEDCAGQTLAPGADCSIEVIFRPSATGPHSDTLSVADSTADGHHDVALSGEGRFGLPDLQVKIDVLGDATNQDDGTIAVPIIGLTGMALVGFLVVTSLPSVIIGIGLLKMRPWARIAGIVISIILLVMIPFGTIVGAYGLWVLFSKDTERLFMTAAPSA
jgi:hypothetical protein